MFKCCQYFDVLFINYHEPYSQIFKTCIYLDVLLKIINDSPQCPDLIIWKIIYSILFF